MMAVFGRWRFLGWHGRDQGKEQLAFRPPGEVPSRGAAATAWYFLVMGLLFLLQSSWASVQHYRAEIAGFFGVDLARICRSPRANVAPPARDLLGRGVVSGRRHLHRPDDRARRAEGALARLRAPRGVAIVVFGSLAGEYAGIFGWTGDLWEWFGNQGFEYLDLGRFWQVLLSVGLALWVVILFRVLRTRLHQEHKGNMPWMFFYAALAIPAFYAVGLLAQTGSHVTTAEYWRWWVVHLWVEDFLELLRRSSWLHLRAPRRRARAGRPRSSTSTSSSTRSAA